MNSKRALLCVVMFATCSVVGLAQRTGNTVDHQFIDMMIEHHGDGIEMARLAESKGTLGELRSFAGRTAQDQESDRQELERMKNEAFPNAGMARRMGSMTMGEMKRMAAQDMRRLNNARKGRDFDRAFLDIMTKHHRMAIKMSNQETAGGRMRDLKTMARTMSRKQQKDIGEMASMRRRVR